MIFNLISAISLILCILFTKLLLKIKRGKIILQTFSIIIFIYKLVWYIFQNIKGQTSIPVEISSLTYFMVAIILTFKIVKAYHLASFFGISAGLGFFIFYILAGFTITNKLSLINFLMGNFSHGYLFISGIFLMKKTDFNKTSKLSIWVTILAMLVWALLFYDIEQPGITFIYYIIKPEYLFISNILSVNILIMISFYTLLITAFYLWIKFFYKTNNRLKTKE